MDDATDRSQKTEQATPKRREDARRKGRVPQSREPATALAFAVLAAGLSGAAEGAWSACVELAVRAWSGHLAVDFTPGGMQAVLQQSGEALARSVAPFALPAMVLGMLAGFLVAGPVFSTEPLRPQWSRVSPMQGLQRLFSTRALAELIKSIGKIVLLGAACATALWGMWPQIRRAALADPVEIGAFAVAAGARMVAMAATFYAALALLNVLYQRWEHEKSLRMTKKEVRDEQKETEGDPQIRARIRQIQGEIARRRMMAEVPKADVVVTNPTRLAVALAYRAGRDPAPRVVAKGAGAIAERIRAIAREHHVPIRENKPLARSLYSQVRLGETIPEALFEAVAVLLAEILRAERGYGAQRRPQ